MVRGSHMTEEARAKISLARRGFKHTKESKEKIRQSLLGHKNSPEAMEKTRLANLGNKNWLGRKHSSETKEKMSLSMRGRKRKPFTLAHRRKISIANRGENSILWRGGISLSNQGLRHSIMGLFEYRQWRSDIFTRDSFTCQDCGDSRGGNLEAHHNIKSFQAIINEYGIKTPDDAIHCAELWNLNNGVTLCETCHKREGRNGRNND